MLMRAGSTLSGSVNPALPAYFCFARPLRVLNHPSHPFDISNPW